jgi:hypothetical protein
MPPFSTQHRTVASSLFRASLIRRDAIRRQTRKEGLRDIGRTYIVFLPLNALFSGISNRNAAIKTFAKSPNTKGRYVF